VQPTEHARTAEEVAKAVFAAIDKHDLESISDCLHPDDIQDFLPIGTFVGRAAVLRLFAELFRALPDLTMAVEHMMADDTTAYVRWRLEGTFMGERFQGILATGRRVHLRGVDAFIKVQDGTIRQNTIIYDGAAFARAIGLLPTPGSRLEKVLVTAFNLKTRLSNLMRIRPARN
jgi:steroid delta-isomerase-like uncharacterized protein